MADIQALFKAYKDFQDLVDEKRELGKCSPQFVSAKRLATDVYSVGVKPSKVPKALYYTVGKARSAVSQRSVICFAPQKERLGEWAEGMDPDNVTKWLVEKNMLLKRDIQKLRMANI